MEGGVIGAVGPAVDLRAQASAVRSFPGCVIMPGFVNAHTHLEYSAFQGFSPPVSFPRWLLRLLLARRKLHPEDWEASALWGAHECVRSGITSIADTSYEGGVVARAARAAGLRARIYLEVFGLDDAELPGTLASLEARLERLQEEFGDRRHGESAGHEGVARQALAGAEKVMWRAGPGSAEYAPSTPPRVRGAAELEPPSLLEWGISPHAPYTVSARLYLEVARLARRTNLPLATHLAESPAEVEFLCRGRGPISRVYQAARLWKGERWRPPHMSPVRYVAATGALGPRTLVIHAVQVDEFDVAVLAGSGAAVAHCPRSNQWLQCGIAPVRLMQAAGVAVGLGTDSLGSNENLDMFAEMRAAAGAGGFGPEEVLRMATLDGARVLGWDEVVGSLEPGKRADLVVVRCGCGQDSEMAKSSGSLDRATARFEDDFASNPVEELVRRGDASDIVMTMVDGVVVFSATEPLAECYPEILARLARARKCLGLSLA